MKKVLTKNECSYNIRVQNEKMFVEMGAKSWKEEHREE